MKPTKERAASFKQRRKDAGLVRFEAWLTPTERDVVKKFIAHTRAK